MMPGHDPIKFVTGLSARLASRSRHVCVLLGAGLAKACGLPDLSELQATVKAKLDEHDRDTFKKILSGGNLEQGLTRLRRISALLVGTQEFEGLTKAMAEDLDAAVCTQIIKALELSKADLKPACSIAAWTA